MARTEWLDAIKHDLVFGLRQLRKSPAFTTVAVLTLALGIGANSAIFSVVYSVLLQPLPYAQSDRIVRLGQRNGADEVMWIPFGNYEAWRTQTTAFDAVGAKWGQGTVTLTGQGETTPVRSTLASAGYWKALSIPPVIGRYFTETEDREGGPPVVVISLALWRSRFNSDPNVLGKAITLDARPYTIVGVAPPGYLLDPPADAVWLPLAPPASRLNDFGDHELTVYGLLKPGASTATAVQQLQALEAPLARAHPHNRYDGGAVARPLVDDLLGDQRARLYLLLGAV
ncbi:MAG: ABC transporter permease, partial [Gemmatimonadaceae bacterium]